MRQQIVFGLFLIAFSLLKVEFQAQTLPSYVPSNGLVGWWPFNGNANDESGNGNHGLNYLGSFVEDRTGLLNSSFHGQGSGSGMSILNLNNFPFGNSNRSISVWFKCELPFYGAAQSLFCYGDNTFATRFNLYLTPNQIGVEYMNGLVYSSFVPDNQWHHFIATYDGNGSNGIRVFLDGIEKSMTIYNATPSLNTLNSFIRTIGRFNDMDFFIGDYDDIAIYNRVLPQEEITALYTGSSSIAGCTNSIACNYNAAATQDDGSCTFPAQTYLNCDGTGINDTDNDGVCNELEVALPVNLPANGLVAWYPFNGNANDESGNGNHGVVNGATLTADRSGNGNSAYLFNGINNNIVSTPDLPASNSPRTISLWTKTNSSSAGLMSAAAYGSGAGGYVIFPAFILNSNGKYYFESGSSSNQLFSESSVSDNNWHQITLTYSGQNTPVRMYVDGVLNASSVNLDLITENSPFVIGSASWADLWFSGIIDDIAIYNRALTQEEITALYSGTSSNNNGGGSGSTAGTPAASVPAGIPYQAVIRDNTGAALVNTPVTVRFTLHENTTSGTTEYQETQSLTTNALGLINTQFGAGTATQGTFAGINWSNTTKFIQVEANTGAGYVDLGTQQMMSVPFAIQANKATAIKNAGLPVYADNAAALAGGLVVREMYRTANGDLKIVF